MGTKSMNNSNPRPIIFTDLDGTFLDHDTYDYTPALPMLERLKALDIVVAPVTSKTLAELELLALPFDTSTRITENGMAISHESIIHTSNANYDEIKTFLATLPESLRTHINGFNDMSIQEVMQHTGLDQQHAEAAKSRLASEPFLWSGSDAQMAEVSTLGANQNLTITRGGRFYHLMGKGDKNTAIRWVLEQSKDKNTISIALGDGPNDVSMLAEADYGVIIPNPHGTAISIQNPKGKIITAPLTGPAGWSAALAMILDELEQTR